MAGSSSGNRIARIIVSRCMKTGKDFGIRWEKTNSGPWMATWSFKIPSSQKNSNDYKQSDDALSGDFKFSSDYPGCPHCQGRIALVCSRCKKIYCHDIEKGIRTRCPWCNVEGELNLDPHDHRPLTIEGNVDR